VGSELVPVGGCAGVRRPEGQERKAMSRPPSRRKTSGRQPRGVIFVQPSSGHELYCRNVDQVR